MTTRDRLSLTEIVDEVSAGRRSAVDVARVALGRVAAYEAVQPAVWINRVAESDVLAQARAVDARIAAGERLPLAGAPFAVKDNIDVAGLATTAACPAFAYEADASAPVVERLISAGAVLIGKTNHDHFATCMFGPRPPYVACGAVYNRLDQQRLELRLGGGGGGRPGRLRARDRHRRLGPRTGGGQPSSASSRPRAAGARAASFRLAAPRLHGRARHPATADATLVDDIVAGFGGDPIPAGSQSARPTARSPTIGLPRPDQLDWLGDSERHVSIRGDRAGSRDGH